MPWLRHLGSYPNIACIRRENATAVNSLFSAEWTKDRPSSLALLLFFCYLYSNFSEWTGCNRRTWAPVHLFPRGHSEERYARRQQPRRGQRERRPPFWEHCILYPIPTGPQHINTGRNSVGTWLMSLKAHEVRRKEKTSLRNVV